MSTDKSAISIPFVALKSFEADVNRQVVKPGKKPVIRSSLCSYVKGLTYTFRGDPEFKKQLKSCVSQGKVAVMGVI